MKPKSSLCFAVVVHLNHQRPLKWIVVLLPTSMLSRLLLPGCSLTSGIKSDNNKKDKRWQLGLPRVPFDRYLQQIFGCHRHQQQNSTAVPPTIMITRSKSSVSQIIIVGRWQKETNNLSMGHWNFYYYWHPSSIIRIIKDRDPRG